MKDSAQTSENAPCNLNEKYCRVCLEVLKENNSVEKMGGCASIRIYTPTYK